MKRGSIVLAAAWLAVAGAWAYVARHDLGYQLAVHRDSTCLGCHQGLHPALVADWHASTHFAGGVGCEGCHGEQHDAIVAARGVVEGGVCAKCHAEAAQEYAESAHGHAWDTVEKSSLFLSAPEAVREAGCVPCHALGRPGADGQRGRCTDCHGGHRFDAAVARRPEACMGCHDGPDRAEAGAWEASAHGAQYRFFGAASGPTCTSCHLGGTTGHADLKILTLGEGRQGTVLEGEIAVPPSPTLSRAEFATRRATTVALCRPCHAQDFAQRALEQADAVKRAADRPLAEAAEIVRSLYADGLLRPMPQDRRPDPVAGHALALGESYTETSAIEQHYFNLTRLHHAATVRGAYHFSAGTLHWQGFAALQGELTSIREEARRLRAEAGPAIAPTIRR